MVSSNLEEFNVHVKQIIFILYLHKINMYLEKLKNQKIVYLIYNNNEITLKRVINKSNKYNDV